MEKGRTEVCTFGPTLTLCFLQKMAKIEKIRDSQKKLQSLRYSNISKSRLYLLSTFRKKYDNFWHYFAFSGKKQDRVSSKIVRTNIWHTLFYPHDSWQLSVKINLVPTLSSLTKRTFHRYFNPVIKFGCFSWYCAYIFEINQVS